MTINEFSDYLKKNADSLEIKTVAEELTKVLRLSKKERFSLRHSSYVLYKISSLFLEHKEKLSKYWTADDAFAFLQKYQKYLKESFIQYDNTKNPERLFYWFLKDTYHSDNLTIIYKSLDKVAGTPEDYVDEDAEPVENCDWDAL